MGILLTTAVILSVSILPLMIGKVLIGGSGYEWEDWKVGMFVLYLITLICLACSAAILVSIELLTP